VLSVTYDTCKKYIGEFSTFSPSFNHDDHPSSSIPEKWNLATIPVCGSCIYLVTRRGGLSGPWLKRRVVRPMVEEAGCQAHENSLQVRELLGINSQGAKL
jgi:hypothetical protein